MIARRTPIARSTKPIARRTRVKPRRATPRRSERVINRPYMDYVRGLPCLFAPFGGCEGRTEADHAGRRGVGQKSSDTETIPLCTRHHRERTDYTGVFRHMKAAEMRAWADDKIAKTREAYARWKANTSGEGVPF